MKQCTNCGTINNENAAFCQGCGASLKDARLINADNTKQAIGDPKATILDATVHHSAKETILDVLEVMTAQSDANTLLSNNSDARVLNQSMAKLDECLFENRYRLVEIVGKGGFSEVWLAEDTLASNKQVAIKKYKADVTGSNIMQFGKEFARVLNCNHTNLLTPKHYGVVDGVPYLEMSYCAKGSITALTGRINETEVWKLIRDVANGLAYLHNYIGEDGTPSPMVHQDIKPDNILIDQQGNYVISDFGISTQIRATIKKSTMKLESAGTSAYMAPERFRGMPQPIKANDIWSLGATVFEIVEGVLPIGDHGGRDQKEDVKFQFVSNISKDLKDVIAACLSFDPSSRPIADELVKVASDKLMGQSVSMPWKHRKSKKRNGTMRKMSSWLVASFLTIAVLFVGFMTYTQKHPVTGNQMLRMGEKFYEQQDYETAMIWFEKAAEKGNDMALFYLGECNEFGYGIDVNEEKAYEYYYDAKERGNVFALYRQSALLQYGTGIEQDTLLSEKLYKQCFAPLEALAQKGNTRAMRYLGHMFKFGDGIEEDESKAYHWYQQASEEGDAASMYHLGQCYEFGTGTEKDSTEAFYWYEQSSNKGCHNGKYAHAMCLRTGFGVEPDSTKSFLLFKELAASGYAGGQWQLGICYLYGYGVVADKQEAEKWFIRAANQIVSYASSLAEEYYFGWKLDKNYFKAAEWARKAAEKGDPSGMFRLAYCYWAGHGVAKDYAQMVYWFQKAADKGYRAAQYNLGWVYDHGYGVAKDYAQAVYWYQKAAEKGIAEACYNLGNCYEYGRGVGVDYSQARYWRQKAKEYESK